MTSSICTNSRSQQDDDLMSTNSLSLMLEQERSAYTSCDYLAANSNSGSENGTRNGRRSKKRHNEWNGKMTITPADRMKIVDWCYALVDQCQCNRENVAFAMNLVDRFASKPSSRDILSDRSQYQLVAVTALYIANKLYERVVLGSDGFSALSQGTYSVEEIEAMELRILHGLSWRLCPPTPLQIGYHILALIISSKEVSSSKCSVEKSTWDFLRDEVAYQTENSVREYYFTTQRASTIAVASILNAIELVNLRHYEDLLKGLLRVLKMFDFDSPIALLAAKERLQQLVVPEEHDACDGHGEDADDLSMVTQEPTDPSNMPEVVSFCQDC